MVWFNTAQESDSSFDELAEGSYRFIVTAATVKATKAGNGQYAEATLEVVDGPAKGQKAWARFTTDNPNAQAVKIGRAQMKGFLTACGVTEPLATPNDFGRLVAHKVLWAEVTHRRSNDKTFVDVGGFSADVPGAPAPTRAPAPTADNSVIPF
jgi:hypothetical protein